eukprot:GHVS01050592.1.p1 GENE.GHVS01050592.1~~GHVS01050592.1.p1  ORF type:complete len:202 (+),score=35.97 GHVS01050592.1:418-1023(+)
MYWFTAPSFSVIPLICPLTVLCSCVYPIYRSLCLLYHPYNPVTTITRVQEHPTSTPPPNFASEYIHWLMYWMLFCLFSMFEYILTSVLCYIPLYMELKCICCFWLSHEEFQGAGWLWVAMIEKHYKKFDSFIVTFYNKHAPTSLKSFFQDGAAGVGVKQQQQQKVAGGEKNNNKNNAAGVGGFDKSRDEAASVGVEGLKNK